MYLFAPVAKRGVGEKSHQTHTHKHKHTQCRERADTQQGKTRERLRASERERVSYGLGREEVAARLPKNAFTHPRRTHITKKKTELLRCLL